MKLEIQNRLGENLKKIRKSKNLTQSELAEKADLSDAMIQSIETGRVWPSEYTITQIAEALEVDFYHFFLPVPTSLEVNDEIELKMKNIMEECFKTFIKETADFLKV